MVSKQLNFSESVMQKKKKERNPSQPVLGEELSTHNHKL